MREALIRLLTSTSSRHRPWQISAAVAIGVLGGVLPKTCLLFYALLAVVYCLPIHLPLAIATMLLLSPVAAVSHPQLGQLGVHSLMHSSWSQFWLRLDSYPLIPWLSLHNSLVNGAVLVGLASLLPTYVLARLFVAIVVPAESLQIQTLELKTRTRQQKVPATVLVPEEISSAAASPLAPAMNLKTVPVTNIAAVNDTTMLMESPSTLSQLERILASYDALEDTPTHDFHTDATGATEADRVIRRAALMVSAVDDILSVIEAEEGVASDSDSNEELAKPAREKMVAETADSDVNRREDFAHTNSLATPHNANSSAPSTGFVVNTPSSESSFDATKKSDHALSPIKTQPYKDADTSISIVRGSVTSTPLLRQNELPEGLQGVHFKGSSEARTAAVHSSVGASENQPNSQVVPRTNANQMGSLISQHSSHTAVIPKSISVANNDRQSAVRDVREGEVLRNLLNHLRELKEKV